MIDVKKLITGFLILTVAAVCSGLIFLSINNLNFTAGADSSPKITITGGDGNAFLPTQTEVDQAVIALAPNLPSSTMFVSSTDPNNFTNILATNFINSVVSANPDGPVGTDADGNATFKSPDASALAASIADATTTQNLQIPNWDAEAQAIPITITTNSSAAALNAYGKTLSDIMNTHINSDTQTKNILSDQTNNVSASDLTYLKSQITNTLKDAASLKVPAPAVAYQKSLLTDLVYEKNLIQLNDLAQTDPVKASLLFQQENNKFYSVQQNFLTQAQNLASKNVSLQQGPSNIQNLFISFFVNTFGMPQANAQLAVIATNPDLDSMILPYEDANQTLDVTAHAAEVTASASLFALISGIHVQNMGEKLQALLKNTLLQILKNTLIAIIQREVLTWIQGSGAPRFITNWGTALVNAAQTTAINEINSEMSCGVYPAFIPQIKVTLNAYYKPGGNICANQFAAALGSNSFQQFYNNFSNGGFIAFGASTLPSGNPYGQMFFNAQSVQLAYNNQQTASAVKAQTSQGFTGNQICSDGSDPNGTHVECESPNNNDYAQPAAGVCNQGYTQVTEENNGLCANGNQPQVTTPAAVTGFTFQSAEDATPKQVSAMNDITGVLNAVMNSLLTSVASAAVNAAGKLVNQGLTSLNGANITAGATTAAPAQIPLACNPSSQTIPSVTAGTGNYTQQGTSTTLTSNTSSNSPTSLSATGGTLDTNGNTPTYYWSDSNGVTSTGAFFSDIFSNPGSYTVTLTDSMASDTPATCTITVQP